MHVCTSVMTFLMNVAVVPRALREAGRHFHAALQPLADTQAVAARSGMDLGEPSPAFRVRTNVPIRGGIEISMLQDFVVSEHDAGHFACGQFVYRPSHERAAQRRPGRWLRTRTRRSRRSRARSGSDRGQRRYRLSGPRWQFIIFAICSSIARTPSRIG